MPENNVTPLYLIVLCNSHGFMSVSIQDSVFRLEPHVENGRGKSPYDPKLLTASMLIGKFRSGYSVMLSCVLEQGHLITWVP